MKINYITHEQYQDAKNKSGRNHLDNVYPKANRKLFPFHTFTNFSLFEWEWHRDKKLETKRYDALICGACGCDIKEHNNGEYYTGYICFVEMEKFYFACSRDCLPKNSLDYYNQKTGNREPVFLPIVMEKDVKYCAVYKHFVRGYRYNLKSYLDGVTMEQYKKISNNVMGGGATWGGFGNGDAYDFKSGKFYYSSKSKHTKFTLTPKEIIKLVNDILHQNIIEKPQLTLQLEF